MRLYLRLAAGCLVGYAVLLDFGVESLREPTDLGDSPDSQPPAEGPDAEGPGGALGPGGASPPVIRDFRTPTNRSLSFDANMLTNRQGVRRIARRRHSLPASPSADRWKEAPESKKPKRGRLSRAAAALRGWMRRAKARLHKAWRGVKERARRAKTGFSRGAAKLFRGMRRPFWRRKPAFPGGAAAAKEGQQGAPQGGGQPTPGGEGPPPQRPSLDLGGPPTKAPPKPPRLFLHPYERKGDGGAAEGREEKPLGAEAGIEGEGAGAGPSEGEEERLSPEMQPPVESLYSALAAAGKAGGAEALPPGEESEGAREEEEFAEAEGWPMGKEREPSSPEEFLTPPSSPLPQRRRRTPSTASTASTGSEEFEFEGLAEAGRPEAAEARRAETKGGGEGVEECGEWADRVSPLLEPVVRMCPDLCPLWSLFSSRGRLTNSFVQIPALAAQLAATVSVARKMQEEGKADEAPKLMMSLRVALQEDKVARVREQTDTFCWFTHLSGIYERADAGELKTMEEVSAALSTIVKNPYGVIEKLKRLMRLAGEDKPRCLAAVEEELKARAELRQILGEEAQRMQAAGSEEEREPDERDAALVQDLLKLQQREACSQESLFLLKLHSESVHTFVQDVEREGPKWGRYTWLSRIHGLRYPRKGAVGVPAEIAAACREFEKTPQPESIVDVSPFALWMFEVGDIRLQGSLQTPPESPWRQTPASNSRRED
ncbi:hypothetical protein Efla_001706 [Eimeria flavescens]